MTLTPGYSDGSAEPLYILEMGLDYTYAVDWDDNVSNQFVVKLHILRDVVPPFATPSENYGLLLGYRADAVV